jgi:hypothetical protein
MMDKRKDPQWIDFKKMMENETGVSELRRVNIHFEQT